MTPMQDRVLENEAKQMFEPRSRGERWFDPRRLRRPRRFLHQPIELREWGGVVFDGGFPAI